MEKRGRVLRNPHGGRGLLMVEGKQYPFLMDALWRSEQPARPGLPVSVDFDAQGNLAGITAVPESQIRSQQMHSKSNLADSLLGFEVADQNKWIPIAGSALLLFSWLFLTAVSIHLPSLGKLDLTVWQILGALNSGTLPSIPEIADSSDPGLLGFVALLALAGPLLPSFWNDRRALLGGALPLGFMGLVGYMLRGMLRTATASQATGGAQTQSGLHFTIFHSVSLGVGGYVSLTLAAYFAVLSVKQFMEVIRARRESKAVPAERCVEKLGGEARNPKDQRREKHA